MALFLTVSIVAVLLAFRLLMPPVPGLVKLGMERWGKVTTIILSAIAILGAVLAIALSRHY